MNKDDLRKLIEKDYSLEVISFGFGVPMEELTRLMSEIENDNELEVTEEKIENDDEPIDASNEMINDDELGVAEEKIELDGKKRKKAKKSRGEVASGESRKARKAAKGNGKIDEGVELFSEAAVSRVINVDYESLINAYKVEIEKAMDEGDVSKVVNERNLLAFAYYKSGQVDLARESLVSLIDDSGSLMAYRQLIYIEKSQGNLEDAKFWADMAFDKFPGEEKIVKQAISIDRLMSDRDDGER